MRHVHVAHLNFEVSSDFMLLIESLYHNLFADRAKPAAGSNMRDKSTINRLKMYKSGGKAVRCAD